MTLGVRFAQALVLEPAVDSYFSRRRCRSISSIGRMSVASLAAIDRLRDEVIHPGAQRGDRQLHVVLSGDDDHGYVRPHPRMRSQESSPFISLIANAVPCDGDTRPTRKQIQLTRLEVAVRGPLTKPDAGTGVA